MTTTKLKVYRSSNKYCKHCPLRSTCIGKSDFKVITESTEKPLYDAMHLKMQTPYAKRITKIRSKTVEPVLGTGINFTNMRRVNSRGIDQATKPLDSALGGCSHGSLNIQRFGYAQRRPQKTPEMDQPKIRCQSDGKARSIE